MSTMKNFKLCQLEISKIMELYEARRQKKRLTKNEMLDVGKEVIDDAICYIASEEPIPDDAYSINIRLALIKDLCILGEMLKKMKKAVLIFIFLLLEPELLSNLYEFGDIYIY